MVECGVCGFAGLYILWVEERRGEESGGLRSCAE